MIPSQCARFCGVPSRVVLLYVICTSASVLGATFEVRPVIANVPYQITGNTITLTGPLAAPALIDFEIHVSGWSPQLLNGVQIAPFVTGGASGTISAHTPACTSSPDCVPLGVVGPGSQCTNQLCGFLHYRTARGDFLFGDAPIYAVSAPDRGGIAFTLASDSVSDPGVARYFGHVRFQVSAGAAGSFTVSLTPPGHAIPTFWSNNNSAGFYPTLVPATVTVADTGCACALNGNSENGILNCVNGNCSGCVGSCDINCDAVVDWVDVGVARCLLNGLTDCCNKPIGACTGLQNGPSYSVCEETLEVGCIRFTGTYKGDSTTCAGGLCLCNADVDGTGTIQVIDAARVADCAQGLPCNCSPNGCDVDCDGLVTWADFGAVWCEFEGGSGCCAEPIGACLMNRTGWPSCIDTTQNACESNTGIYQGNGTSCLAGCGRSGDPACPNGTFCEFDMGTCAPGTEGGLCQVVPASCSPSSAPVCGCDWVTYANSCEARRAQVSVQMSGACPCAGTRDLGDLTYCPERSGHVRIVLAIPAGVSGVAVEDTPPAGWAVGAISNGGFFDAVNGKVKWGPFFAPFPLEVSYDATPPAQASGTHCFAGIVSMDGSNSQTCGDTCVDLQCCPYLAAETPAPNCAACASGSCASCTSGACEDGVLSLCEVISFGCAWMRGCNDDIAGLTRAAFIWKNGECYCWDDLAMNWIPDACGQGDVCCGAAVLGATSSQGVAAVAKLALDEQQRGGTSQWQVSVDITPPDGASGVAVEVAVPKQWSVRRVGEGGSFDPLHGKIKWGPFFGDAPLALTATIRTGARTESQIEGRLWGKPIHADVRAISKQLHGTVSIDGMAYPLTAE